MKNVVKVSKVLGYTALLAAVPGAWAVSAHAADMGRLYDQLKSIYGTDSRQDLYEVTDASIVKLADSTVALVHGTQLTPNDSGGNYTLSTSSYADDEALCSTERFYDQQTAAFCSGSLVAPDLILTAGHCVTNAEDCSDVRFVFGFDIRTKGGFTDQVPSGEVYGCREIVDREQQGQAGDFALIRLDRPVTNHAVLKVAKKSSLKQHDPLIVIGHPTGLPTKVATGEVRDPDLPGYILTNLDTFGGNSGSAVFNSRTLEIEGVLVRGDTDFQFDDTRGCDVSYTVGDNDGRGEDVTKISEVTELMTAAPGPTPTVTPSPVPTVTPNDGNSVDPTPVPPQPEHPSIWQRIRNFFRHLLRRDA